MIKHKKKIESKSLFYYFDSIFKNKKRSKLLNCRELFLALINRFFRIKFIDEFELSGIGFYLKTEPNDNIYYELGCEHVGSDLKIVLLKFTNGEQIDGFHKYIPIHENFVLKKFLKELIEFKEVVQ